nr:hypothetical protein [Tanacetum cinerariifolium]
MKNKKHIINLETFRDMLHVCPRVPGQSFDELPFEADILEFLRFLGHSDEIQTLTDVNVNKLFQPWRSFGAVINKSPKPKASARKKRGDSDTSLTPPIATPAPITTATPVPKITAAAKGKQPAKAKSSSDLSKAARTDAEQLKIVLRRSRQERHISQHGGSSTDEGTEESEDDGNDEEDQGLRLSDEERIHEEEEAEVTTSSDAPIPPTPIPSDVLQNLPTFNSVFCFDERLKSLET